VHIIGVEPNEASEASAPNASSAGTGHFDHMAFLATDWPKMRARLRQHGVDYIERTVPVLGLHQVFLVDPSGVRIELSYEIAS